jgi:predicted RNA-binding Zn-ribbon protein involved in translation (DUF1610 family)
MAKEKFRVQTVAGRCPTHGEVQATKEVPNFGWPVIVYLFRRVRSAFQPYRCPQCGEKVQKASA